MRCQIAIPLVEVTGMMMMMMHGEIKQSRLRLNKLRQCGGDNKPSKTAQGGRYALTGTSQLIRHDWCSLVGRDNLKFNFHYVFDTTFMPR